MFIDKKVMDELMQKAQESPRLRMNLDLRTTPEDQSQRMLNAMLPGTVLPIHRHMVSTEVVVMLRGMMDEVFFDDEGRETERFHLDANTDNRGLSIPLGQWHTVEVFEPTVILEAKDGPYVPLSPDDVLTV